MCSPTTCRTCGKTTWTGCGNHIDEVKAQVPAGQWCDGHHDAASAREGSGTDAGSESRPASFFARIFGR